MIELGLYIHTYVLLHITTVVSCVKRFFGRGNIWPYVFETKKKSINSIGNPQIVRLTIFIEYLLLKVTKNSLVNNENRFLYKRVHKNSYNIMSLL